MLPFELRSTDLDTVKIERKNHKSARVRTRLWILWFLHLNYSRQAAAQLASCSPDTITDTVRRYNKNGLGALLKPQGGKSRARHFLKGKFKKVKRALIKARIHTVEQARKHLEENYGYFASWEATRRLLHRLGLRYRKINPFPGNPKRFEVWQQEQEKWVKHLNKLYSKAKQGEISLTFADAAHFVYGKCGAYLWSDGPRYKATGSSRYRLNVYGAFDPVSNRLLSQYSSDNVNAEYVIGFLQWLRKEHYTDKDSPLHFVLDNARYQHCKAVKEEAKKLNIILEFQPSYSPNLNLIERAWKYFKKLVGRAYYATKQEFEQMIIEILQATDEDKHQQQFKTLLTMNFQTYSKSEILSC